MAGLLDYYFNPQTYSGGLLNMPNAPMVMPGAGFGQAEQMSARQNVPIQQPQMPQQQPSFLDGISNGLANNSNTLLGMGAQLLSGEGFGGALKGAMVGGKLDREQRNFNATEKALAARGLPPEIASVVARNPTLLAAALKRQVGGGTFGLNPIYGKNEKGDTVLLQTSDTGDAIQTRLPEGVSVSTGVDKVDLGTQWMFRDKKTGNIVGYAPKDVAGKKEQEEVGKGLGEAKASLASIKSKMPGLEKVVGKLSDLSGKATYTLGGQVVDYGRRQIGIEPRDAAVARSEYESIVSNQILPLLRDTFGAQFTEREGATLRATLGDPNKHPKEKQAVLKAFIEQKRRDVEALEARTGRRPMTPAQAPASSGVIDYRTYFGGQ